MILKNCLTLTVPVSTLVSSLPWRCLVLLFFIRVCSYCFHLMRLLVLELQFIVLGNEIPFKVADFFSPGIGL